MRPQHRQGRSVDAQCQRTHWYKKTSRSRTCFDLKAHKRSTHALGQRCIPSVISSCNPIQEIHAHVIGLLSRPLAEVLSVKLAKL